MDTIYIYTYISEIILQIQYIRDNDIDTIYICVYMNIRDDIIDTYNKFQTKPVILFIQILINWDNRTAILSYLNL